MLVEGGGILHGTVLKSGMLNRVYAYVAPKLIGGGGARPPVAGEGFPRMEEALKLADTDIIKLGSDFCITGVVEKDRL